MNLGRPFYRVCFYLLLAFVPLRISHAAPCFPAPVWFQEVAYATAWKSPLLQQPVMVRGFVAGAVNNIDPRLQLAIAGQETFFGLRGPCPAVRNAWGILDSQGRCRSFVTWDFAVNWTTNMLARCYLYGREFGSCSSWDRPRRTIPEIGEKWCASGCGDWVLNVTAFYSTGVRADGRRVPASFKGSLWNLAYGGTCCGDCNGSGQVDIADLILLVGLNLGYPGSCPKADIDVPADGIFVNDTVSAVGEAQMGCLFE
ncbi:MAG: hypothetical protein KatS3mg077_1555 [Candidatus Binatia bacterium]|nr:MAG: hypothetical protein KatS3mg077_1555 [Candidatus Binatia bacterium]